MTLSSIISDMKARVEGCREHSPGSSMQVDCDEMMKILEAAGQEQMKSNDRFKGDQMTPLIQATIELQDLRHVIEVRTEAINHLLIELADAIGKIGRLEYEMFYLKLEKEELRKKSGESSVKTT